MIELIIKIQIQMGLTICTTKKAKTIDFSQINA